MAGEGKGWISLYRSILEHWLWQEKPFSKGQAWLDILLSANHKDKKLLLGNELINVKRGSFITSQKKLMERWGWGNTKVRNFLKLLKEDNMIECFGKKYTLIKINNYKMYQKQTNINPVISTDNNDMQTDNKLQANHKQTDNKLQANTNNNDNNDNNDNKSSCSSKGNIEVFKYYEKCNFLLSPMLIEKIAADIEIYSKEWLMKAAEVADENGKHNYNYVRGILENWKANGIKQKKEGVKNGGYSKDTKKEHSERNKLAEQGIGL